MSEVRVTSYCECPFSTAIDLAQRALRERHMQVSPVETVAENVAHATKVVDDGTDRTRLHDALLLAWKPEHRGLFPDFTGVLTVRPKDRGVWMRLQGRYNPPFGIAGKLFDVVAGQRIAERTVRRLLGDVVNDIEAKWSAARRNGA
jgi:hypothetical protein